MSNLGLADRLLTSWTPAQLADPATWTLDVESFRVGPFSALQQLSRLEAAQLSVGPHPHCVSPSIPAPVEVAHLRRVSVQPREFDSCLQWFTVDLFVDANGAAHAVDLYEP